MPPSEAQIQHLAKELNIPVIALSQLSRAVETRGGSKRPMLSDLRESGSIEQDADMVLFIYRPEYYHLDTFEDNTPADGMAEIMFEKNRHGSTGNVRVRFESQYTKFSDVTTGYYSGTENTFTDEGNASSNQNPIQPNQSFSMYESSMNDEPAPTPPDYNADMPF